MDFVFVTRVLLYARTQLARKWLTTSCGFPTPRYVLNPRTGRAVTAYRDENPARNPLSYRPGPVMRIFRMARLTVFER